MIDWDADDWGGHVTYDSHGSWLGEKLGKDDES